MILDRFLRRHFAHRDVSNFDRSDPGSATGEQYERPVFFRAFRLGRIFRRDVVLTFTMKNMARGRWSFASLRFVRGWSMSPPLKPSVRTMDDYRAGN